MMAEQCTHEVAIFSAKTQQCEYKAGFELRTTPNLREINSFIKWLETILKTLFKTKENKWNKSHRIKIDANIGNENVW